jgi:hypothetical protein
MIHLTVISYSFVYKIKRHLRLADGAPVVEKFGCFGCLK